MHNLSVRSYPIWLRLSSIVTLMASVLLLWISLFAYHYQSVFVVSLVSALLVALIFAVFLNVYSLWYIRREYKERDQTFRDADSEFSSIFHNVLDGILLVNNAGICLDANPAASEILRCSANEIVGYTIQRFFLDSAAFAERWNSFLQEKKQRGRVRLVAGDGMSVVVDFTAAANYLPGRHALVICDVTERTNAETCLRKSEERFQHMANNIQEIFWMMDAATQEVTYVNRAYAQITGHSVQSLQANPSGYRELIHAEDRVRVLSRLHEIANTGRFDEEFRFTRADGAVRWIWAKGFPVPSDEKTRWIVGTAQDITSRKQAEMKISEQLDIVEAARAEAEALRKSTLALSQNLAMDSVLDTLLHCISDLVPFDRATVLFVDDGPEFMVAREVPRRIPKRIGMTVRASHSVFLERVLFEKTATLLTDVAREPLWQADPPLDHLQSWLGVPLIAAGRVLGILSLASNTAGMFTAEHLRLAKSLAIPAAVAIQNARTHERAEIYAAELQLRLGEIAKTQRTDT